MAKRWNAVCAVLLSGALLAACGGDDGSGVRANGSGSASGSGSGSGSAAGGSSAAVANAAASDDGSDDPVLAEAAASYKEYIVEQVDMIVADAKDFTDAVRSGDVAAAKAAYAPSRQAWERIEPAAGLVEEIDGKVDARVDDFESESDPEFTGWHRLEYQLWEVGTIDDQTKTFADQLDTDLASLKKEAASLAIPPAVLAVGSAELIEEAANGKISGEEDRYSHTDLWDLAANVEGSKAAYELLRPALQAKDSALAGDIDKLFSDAATQIDATREGDGYISYETFDSAAKNKLQATLADLSEHLSDMAGVLGLGG